MREHLREIISAVSTLVLTAVVVAAISLAQQYGCSGAPEQFHYMKPTIKPGSKFAIRRDVQRLEAVPPGTVVIYRVQGAESNMIGRVVAHPGATVTTRAKTYIVDGEKLRSKANAECVGSVEGLIIPRDCVLVGFDSGARVDLKDCIVPLDNILGKPVKPL